MTWRLIGEYANLSHKPPNAWWKLIQEDWDSRSYYEKGDVVRYKDSYYRNVYVSITPPNNAPDDSAAWIYWEKVKKDPNNGWIKA